MSQLDDIKAQIAKLSPEERHLLREWLAFNEAAAFRNGRTPEDIEQAWLDVAQQRLADIQCGNVEGISAEEVLKKLRE